MRRGYRGSSSAYTRLVDDLTDVALPVLGVLVALAILGFVC
jgi:hypothetical protein